jgi:hypothetical protein
LAGAQKVDVVSLRKLVQKEWHHSVITRLLIHITGQDMLHVLEIVGGFFRRSVLKLNIFSSVIFDLLDRLLVAGSICLDIGQTSTFWSQSDVYLDVEKDWICISRWKSRTCSFNFLDLRGLLLFLLW